MFKRILPFLAVILIFPLLSCEKKEPASENPMSIAVFVPGILEGSPTYEMMDQGVRTAAEKYGASVLTVEGGFNQAEWKDQILLLAAEGKYDLIVSSNPALPEICRQVKDEYPDQEFLVLEGSGIVDDTVTTFLFRHEELSFLLGYFAGLVTESDMPGANPDLKVGMIVGQEYPEMNRRIRPGFELGLWKANPEIELDFRVVGNWYDAAKASDLALNMFNNGVDVILVIAGGANQGVVSAARDSGKYVIWYDTSGYDLAPGVVIGSGLLREDLAAEMKVEEALTGVLVSGSSAEAGVREGFLDFIDNHPAYREYVPKVIREKQSEMLSKLKSGEILVTKPLIEE